VVSIHRSDTSKYLAFRDASAILKAAILSAVGLTIKTSLSHPRDGTTRLTVQGIVESLTLTYGTMNSATLSQLTATLDTKFSSELDFYPCAITMATTLGYLAENGHPKSEFDKVQLLRAACSNLPSATDTITYYLRNHQDMADRTFALVVDYVRLNGTFELTAGTAGYAGSTVHHDASALLAENQRLVAENYALKAQILCHQQPLHPQIVVPIK
jgi:hypothetical protein